jgi:crossover junction endodeoxyribonuclease RuvC
VQHGVKVSEYSAKVVKKSVVGTGAASKEQVQHMVRTLLGITDKVQADAADGLAIALCHGHSRNTVNLQRPSLVRRRSRRR